MRTFTLFIILAVSCYKINAQNVGIGTPSPQLKLDVVGSVGLRNSGAAWDHLFFEHDGDVATINAGGANLGLKINVGNSASGTYGGQPYTEAMRLLPNGNVGIGTSTPAARLDVNGTFQFGLTGTTLNAIGQVSGNFTGGTVSANSSVTFTVNLAALTTAAAVMFNPSIDLPDGIILTYVRVASTGTIFGKMYNVKTTAILVPDFVATFTWIK